DHGPPELKEDDQAEADTRRRTAKFGAEETVIERAPLAGLGVADDVPGCGERNSGSELLLLILPLLSIERVTRRRPGRTERDTPYKPQQWKSKGVAECADDQVTHRNGGKDCHECVRHGHGRH